MIRLTLRQFRSEAFIAFGALAALAIVLAITGVHLAHVSEAFQTACRAAGNCASLTNPAVALYKPLQIALPLIVILAPALLGVFFGAPLVARELETGTFRLAWTQTVTRKRWLAAKLGLVGVAAMAVAGLLTWMVDWWARPLDAINQDRFDPMNFGYHGIAPIGYTAFAFALGATAGLLLRRTVPAMAVTLAGYAAARIAVTYWIRPHLAAPLQANLTFNQAPPSFLLSPIGAGGGGIDLSPGEIHVPGAWIYSAAIADNAGNTPSTQDFDQLCPALTQALKAGQIVPPNDFQACSDTLATTYHTVTTYQPADQFWPFQWAELAIFLTAAAALCTLTYWWISHHYTARAHRDTRSATGTSLTPV